jgi:hypothetical protein
MAPHIPPSHLPQVSDYDSDFLASLSDHPAPPTQPPRPNLTNDELNFLVLRRHSPSISAILSIAPYAVIYEFSPHPAPTWTKSNIEGSLFICQLSPGETLGEDRYIAIVLNRRGLENFQAELREADNTGVEITDEYVILSLMEEGVQKIYGIFIFSEGPGSSTERTRTLNADLMKQCAVQAGLSLEAAEAKAQEALPPQQHNGHACGTAESSVGDGKAEVPMGRQISLQELFGRQRAEDASWSVRMHSPEGRGQSTPQIDGGTVYPQSGTQIGSTAEKPDILGDLFRKAGLGYRQ